MDFIYRSLCYDNAPRYGTTSGGKQSTTEQRRPLPRDEPIDTEWTGRVALRAGGYV
ncbi:Uncharacterised protein [Chlamydia trachomatis]|nr:Uncharacterised protein [Chlamydia trachomatis]